MNGRRQSEPSVYFFGTCLIDRCFPEAGIAAVQMLQQAGVRVIFPPGQTCCGQPAYNAGRWDAARDVARAQVRLFPRDLPVVVPSGSCAAMMKYHYPELFSGDRESARIARFSGRVIEWSQYLVRVLGIRLEDRGRPVTVAWHTSCHALREMDAVQDAKSLLLQLKNVRLLTLARETECCGFGGAFSVNQPEISGAMVRDKVADITGTGADLYVTSDCGCLLNISGAMDRARRPVPGRHLADFLRERTDG